MPKLPSYQSGRFVVQRVEEFYGNNQREVLWHVIDRDEGHSIVEKHGKMRDALADAQRRNELIGEATSHGT